MYPQIQPLLKVFTPSENYTIRTGENEFPKLIFLHCNVKFAYLYWRLIFFSDREILFQFHTEIENHFLVFSNVLSISSLQFS